MTHKKTMLAEKICPVCNRPFTWRKRWASCWEDVKYCSQSCRRNRSQQCHLDQNSSSNTP